MTGYPENVAFKIDEYEFMNYQGRKWLKIFYLSENVRFNLNPNMYSLMKYIPYIKRPNSKYTFILRYPGHDGENIFSQTVTPFGTYSTAEEMGLESGNSTWIGELGRGLMLSTSFKDNTYMECGDNSLWHFAIGAFSSWGNKDTFPGPRVDVDGNIIVRFDGNSVILWMEIKNYANFLIICQCTTRCPLYSRIDLMLISVFISI